MSTTNKPTFWQKMTTLPKCHEYMTLMIEMDKLNKSEMPPEINHIQKFTQIEYDLDIDRTVYPGLLSMGKTHELRCTEDGTKCILAEYANAPFSSNLAYCVDKYSDKFRS